MGKPENCSETIFRIMGDCWEEKTKARPTMKQVLESLMAIWNELYVEEKFKVENVQNDGEYGLTMDLNYETKNSENVAYSNKLV